MRKLLSSLLIVASLSFSMAVQANPGCVGKMWNPLTDLDFRLLGPIKLAGSSIMPGPSNLGSPPEHKSPSQCFCKDGIDTGFGFGMSYWLPSYMVDVARQAGCVGFLQGTNLLPYFLPLSSSQEFAVHKTTSNTTNMQIHKARADVIALAGKSVFEKCGETPKEFSIDYLTEPDFVFQNDLYSAMLSPQNAIIASLEPLSSMACGFESIANTLGGWRDSGICGWKGTRMPLTANSISRDSAQVSNMEVLLKFMTRSALMGVSVRTLGTDAVCGPKGGPSLYNPFQHRYQWSYPAKVSTRFNVDVIRWGMFMRDAGQGGFDAVASANKTELNKADATQASTGTGGVQELASRVLSQLPKPLNYPTRESGYMQIWEARQCCMKILTIESVAKFFAGDLFTEEYKTMYDLYNTASTLYSIAKTVDSVLDLVSGSMASSLGSASAGAEAGAGSALPSTPQHSAADLTSGKP